MADAGPADVAAITDARLVVYNGGDYDHFVDQVLDEHAGVQRVNAFAVGGHQAGSNPHVFYVLDTVSAVANVIAEKLAAIDTTHAADYRANAQKFKAQLQDLAGNERAIGAAHPGTSAIATEDIARYLEIATRIADKTPAGYYKAMLDLVNSRGVQVVLYNPQTDTQVTHRIVDAAKAAGVPVVEVRETLTAGTDFLTWQRQTVDRLSAALRQVDNHSP